MQLFEFFSKYIKKEKLTKIKTRENVAGDFFLCYENGFLGKTKNS